MTERKGKRKTQNKCDLLPLVNSSNAIKSQAWTAVNQRVTGTSIWVIEVQMFGPSSTTFRGG